MQKMYGLYRYIIIIIIDKSNCIYFLASLCLSVCLRPTAFSIYIFIHSSSRNIWFFFYKLFFSLYFNHSTQIFHETFVASIVLLCFFFSSFVWKQQTNFVWYLVFFCRSRKKKATFTYLSTTTVNIEQRP